MFTKVAYDEIASSKGFSAKLVWVDRVEDGFVRYSEGGRQTSIRVAGRVHGRGEFVILVCPRPDQSWDHSHALESIPPLQREAIVRNVISALRFLGLAVERFEGHVWTGRGDRWVESAYGFRVERTAAGEVRYAESDHVMAIAVSDELVAAWPVVRVNERTVGRWLPPFDGEPVDEEHRRVIQSRLDAALRELGARRVEFVDRPSPDPQMQTR